MARVVGVVALSALFTYGGLGWLAMAGYGPDAVQGSRLASFPVLLLVGLLILRHRPRHGVGVLLLLAGLSHPLAELLDRAALAFASPVLRALSAIVFVASWVLVISLLLFFAPDGRLPSPRWRPAVWAVAAMTAVACGAVAVQYATGQDGLNRVLAGCLVGTAAAGLLSTISLISRWPRAGGTTRRRIVVLLAGGTLMIGLAATTWTAGYPLPMVTRLSELVGLVPDQPKSPRAADVFEIVQVLVYPIIAYVAIVRERWFRADVNPVRLAAYTGLTVMAVGVYALTMMLLTRLPSQWEDSIVPLVGGAVAVVALVHSRSPLERAMERTIFGHRRSVADALAGLEAGVAAAREPDEVLPAALESLRRTLRMRRAVLYTTDSDQPVVCGEKAGGGVVVEYTLEVFGHAEGRLELELRGSGDRLDRHDRQVVDRVVPGLALLARSVRLAAAAQEAARARVLAHEVERARLRRDLHDGLGPVLAGLTLQVDALSGQIDDAAARSVTSGIKAGLTEAMEGVRQVIEGLRPGGLDHLGLVGLLSETARSLSGPDMRMSVDGDRVRFHPAAEVAAYRIAAEAMTNAAKHSGGDRCDVRVERNGAMLDVLVVDNGGGICPDATPGVGLGSMRERAEELGGSFRMLPSPGGGTVVHASLPVEGLT